jgi:hypothetical protein
MRFFIYICNLAFFTGISYGQSLVRSSINSLSSVKTEKIRQTVGQTISSVPSSNFYFGYQSPILRPKKIQYLDAILVYPNPVRSALHVTVPHTKFTFKFFNFSGQLVKSGKLITKKTLIELDQLPTGIYNLVILTKNGTIVYQMKIVKE